MTSLQRRTVRDNARRLGLIKDTRPCPCRECGHTKTYRHVAGWPVRSGPLTVIGHLRIGAQLIDHEYVEVLADGRKQYVTQPYPVSDGSGTLAPAGREALRLLRDAGYRVQVLPPGYGRHNDGVLYISLVLDEEAA